MLLLLLLLLGVAVVLGVGCTGVERPGVDLLTAHHELVCRCRRGRQGEERVWAWRVEIGEDAGRGREVLVELVHGRKNGAVDLGLGRERVRMMVEEARGGILGVGGHFLQGWIGGLEVGGMDGRG